LHSQTESEIMDNAEVLEDLLLQLQSAALVLASITFGIILLYFSRGLFVRTPSINVSIAPGMDFAEHVEKRCCNASIARHT
jgi:hypothetical protein